MVAVACICAVAVTILGAGAQTPSRGALLVAGAGPLLDGRVVSVDLATNTISTLLALPGFGHTVQSVTMAEDNRAWIFSVHDSNRNDGWIGRMRAPGSWTTLYRFPVGDGPQTHALDVDGTVLVATRNGAVLDIDAGGRATTLYAGSALINALATEPVSGFPVWGEFGASGRVRVFDRVLAATVSGPTVPFIRAICVDERATGLLIGSAALPPSVLRWSTSGLTTFAASAPADAIGSLEDGTFAVGGQNGRRLAVVHLDGLGTAIRSVDVTGVLGVVRSIAAYGARGLSGSASMTPNASLPLHFQSPTPGDANMPYVILPSLSTTPGLTITPSMHIAVNVDALTQLALAGFLPGAPGFIGALDPQASAQASLFLPGTLRGVRIYLAGVVLDLSQPWPGLVRTVTNTLAITLP